MQTFYHAGLVCIKKFYIPFGGLHMGGKGSALEAALRKLRKMEDPMGALYLHSVRVDTSNLLTGGDLGDAISWEKSYDNQLKRINYSGWKYKNLFEPDVSESICLFDTKLIHRIFSVEKLFLDEAESKLEAYEQNKFEKYW